MIDAVASDVHLFDTVGGHIITHKMQKSVTQHTTQPEQCHKHK